MSTTLSYFDFDGSRGLECRLALTVAGVPFTDNRLNRPQWAEMKPTVPFGALPVLEHDGRTLAQSNAILRYIGATHGMHPTDAWTAAEHDALMQSVEDLRHKVPGQGLSEEEKKTQREEFAAGWLTRWCTTVSESIQGPFVQGAALNVVDIKLYVILRAYITGGYDHIPGSFFDAFPKIQAFYAAVDAHPPIKAYFQGR
jgi:prostaglandin-H2 D-isomerase / glutathione transferase